MSNIFGIDLGTTNSVIAQLKDGRAVPLSISGSAIVPSVVLFSGERVVVGREARNLELQHPAQTIRSVKRKMGQAHRYSIDGREFTPEQVSAQILRALKEGAEAATGLVVQDVVITVPAYFNDAQRRATLSAGELAGLNVLRLLNEPTSASLIYAQLGKEGLDAPEIVMIYDLGGGTFDVSILEVFDGVREVRSTTGNSALGGDDFDELLVRFFLDELKRLHAVDPRDDLGAMARLRRLAEDTKIKLSSETEVQVQGEFLTTIHGKAIHLDLVITRSQFQSMLQPLLSSTIELAERALTEANLNGEVLSRILLVGGSTRIPMVRELLSGAFDAEIHEEVDPDLAVGLGAAIQAGLLVGAPVERVLVDVAAHSLGVSALNDEEDEYGEMIIFVPVLHRNTALPAERTKEFYTAVEQQEKIQVKVYQGESRHLHDDTLVGEFSFSLIPSPRQSPVSVKFAYDLSGVVMVSVSQTKQENSKTVAFSVADASRKSTRAEVVAPAGAVERKARALLEKLTGEHKEELSALLDDFLQADDKEEAEEALLDFFLDYEEE